MEVANEWDTCELHMQSSKEGPDKDQASDMVYISGQRNTSFWNTFA